MGDDRHRVDQTGLRTPDNTPTMPRAGLALAGVLATVLLVTVSVLSTTATVDAASHPPIQAQQSGDAAMPDTDSMSDEEFVTLLASAELGPYAREDALADTFSMERAASFLDRVAVTWGEKYGCVTCHTNGLYLTAPPEIFGERRAFEIAHDQAARYVRSWRANDVPGNDVPAPDVPDVVGTSAFLAINEAQSGEKELSDITVEALDRAWSLQDEGGHWTGFVSNWPPFYDRQWPVTLMVIATGMAPGDYASTDAAVEGMRRIRDHIDANPPEFAHNRGMLLWAGSVNEGLVSDADRQRWIDELLDLQRDDGGWASGKLGVWRMRKGLDTDPPVTVESDGYGTGFVMYVLRQAGVPASHAAIQRGVGWLKANQRAGGYWWTQSIRNSFTTSNFLTHAGTTFAVKALAASTIETGGVANTER